MSLTFGAATLGQTAPAGYLQESSQEVTIEVATVKGVEGQTVLAKQKPRSLTVTTLKCKGDATFSTTVSRGSFTTGITSAKVSQTNDDFSTSEVTFTTYA